MVVEPEPQNREAPGPHELRSLLREIVFAQHEEAGTIRKSAERDQRRRSVLGEESALGDDDVEAARELLLQVREAAGWLVVGAASFEERGKPSDEGL
jgi:hypothetical protein